MSFLRIQKKFLHLYFIQVYLSYGDNLFFKAPDYVIHKPLVDFFQDDEAHFEDGTKVKFDHVIYCTGSSNLLCPIKCNVRIF